MWVQVIDQNKKMYILTSIFFFFNFFSFFALIQLVVKNMEEREERRTDGDGRIDPVVAEYLIFRSFLDDIGSVIYNRGLSVSWTCPQRNRSYATTRIEISPV